MKKTIIAALAFAASVGLAQAQDLTIATGKEGGGYDKAARELSQRLGQRQIGNTVLNLNGSEEISLALCGGKADIGIMQIDALYARALEGCTLKAAGIYGREVAVLLLPPKSRYDELSDLSAKDSVLVDTIGSGSSLFWQTVVKIENGDDGSKDDWAKATPVYDPISLANTSAEMGELQAVVLVRRPDSKDITGLLQLGWTIGELWDKDIDDLAFNSGSLYNSMKVEVAPPNGRKTWNYGYEVRSFYVVSDKLARGDRNTFNVIAGAVQ